MKSKARIAIVCVMLIGAGVVLRMTVGNGSSAARLTYSQFLKQVENGRVVSETMQPAIPAPLRRHAV